MLSMEVSHGSSEEFSPLLSIVWYPMSIDVVDEDILALPPRTKLAAAALQFGRGGGGLGTFLLAPPTTASLPRLLSPEVVLEDCLECMCTGSELCLKCLSGICMGFSSWSELCLRCLGGGGAWLIAWAWSSLLKLLCRKDELFEDELTSEDCLE
jgi:hypothetical protein